MKSEDSSNLRQQVRFIMFSRHFLRIIRQSIQMVCPVFSRVVSFRRVEGPNRTLVSKTSATCSHHGRRSVFRARAVEQLEMVRKQNLATNKAFLDGYIFSDEFPLGKQTCLSRQLQFPPGKQTCLSRQQQFPPGKQTCFSRQQQFPSGRTRDSCLAINKQQLF